MSTNRNNQLESARILFDRVIRDFPIKERLLRVGSEFRILSSKDMWWQNSWKVGGLLSTFANDKKK